MSVPAEGNQLVNVVVLLGAAVVAVPLFAAGAGVGAGYLAAGLAIGPFGIGFFSDPKSILHVAELGVVMFLFIIGLRCSPRGCGSCAERSSAWVWPRCHSRRAADRVGLLAGLSAPAAFMAAMGFVLSSTAIVMQILAERDETASAQGQRIVSILLLEDLAIVPLLALAALLAPAGTGGHGDPDPGRHRAGLCAGAAGGWPMAAQSAVPPAGRGPRARGDDGGGAAGGAGRGLADGAGRPVHRDGRIPGRRAAVRIDFPASAGSRGRTVPGHSAGPVLPGRGYVAGSVRGGARMAVDPGGGADLHGGQVHRRLCRRRALRAPPMARRRPAPRCWPRAASSPSCCTARPPRSAFSTPISRPC